MIKPLNTFVKPIGANNTSQLDKILNWAKGQLGSTAWGGRCQAFVCNAYYAGIGEYRTSHDALSARRQWMKSGTASDLKPPAGAAVYFVGTPVNGKNYGHVALSMGDGVIIDPLHKVVKSTLKPYMHNGYLGWGWNGGVKPSGAFGSGFSTSASDSKNGNVPSPSGGSSAASSAVTDSNDTAKKTTVEISKVVVKNESGSSAVKSSSNIGGMTSDDDIFLLIESGGKIYRPYICDDIKVTRERTGAPSKMTFSCVDIDGMTIEQGSTVSFRYKNNKIFFGYVFSLERSSDGEKVDITCYDQLRYFKNQDSFVYNKTYTDLLKYICSKYGFKTGTVENTLYKIPTNVAEGSLFDICSKASGRTILSNKKHFVLFDDFGQICLKNIENMRLPLLIDSDTFGQWTVKETIDSDVYNRVMIKQDNSETGERGLFIANDAKSQKKWGILTLYEEGDENVSAATLRSRAAALLKYYNRINKTLKITNCLGHPDVRGGSSVIVHLNVGKKKIQHFMVVEKVEHTFSEGVHLMDLNLYGGDFSA